MSSKDFVFVLGGPGSGKGTQSKWIADEYGLGYLSTGDLLREAVAKVDNPPPGIEETELEELRRLQQIMKSGGLVDDAVVIGLIKKTTQQSDKVHWLIDGFPRKMSQCTKFVEEMGECTAVLCFEVSDEVLTQRLLKRGETSGRADDNLVAIQNRIQTFHNESADVIQHYKGKKKAIVVDGERSVNAVRADCIAEIRKLWHIPVKEGEPKQEAVKTSCCNLL